MQPIIECVPNFSEGRNLQTIKAITDAIESVEGIRLLDVDPGKATGELIHAVETMMKETGSGFGSGFFSFCYDFVDFGLSECFHSGLR